MGRPKTFDEREVITQASELFAAQGFHGTSIDDLVQKTGLLRGSLYKAFGSKRNLFLIVLQDLLLDFKASERELDLLTVALKDLALDDKEVSKVCRKLVNESKLPIEKLLGKNLLTKMKAG